MTIKKVRAKSAKAAKAKAKRTLPKGKHVKKVDMMDKTAGRKEKTYRVMYDRKHKKLISRGKRTKLDLSIKGKSFGATWEPGDRKRHHHRKK